MSSIYISFNEAKQKNLLNPGTKILSFPNRSGDSLEGLILGVTETEISVDYKGLGRSTIKTNGRLLNNHIETNLDIAMVKIDD